MTDDLFSKCFSKPKKKSLLKEYALPIALGLWAVKRTRTKSDRIEEREHEGENEQIIRLLKEISKQQKKEKMEKPSFFTRVFSRLLSLFIFILEAIFLLLVVIIVFHIFT